MSQDSLIFNGKKYISSRRASEITGYTTDYIGQLARGKKITSRMVGRNRFVDENELLEYKANFSFTTNFASGNSDQFNHRKNDLVSEPEIVQRSQIEQLDNGYEDENVSQTNISDKRDQKVVSDYDENKALNTKISFIGSLLVVILVGVFLNTQPGAQGFKSFSNNLLNSETQNYSSSGEVANVNEITILDSLQKVDEVFLGYLDTIDRKISLVFVGARDKILSLFEDDSDVIYVDNTNPGVEVVNGNLNQDVEFSVDDEKLKQYVREIMLSERNTFAPGGPYGGVVALPSSGDPVQDEILKQRIKDSFSDEVTVQFDSSGTSGVIRPVFKSGAGLEENYMFLLVPVKK